MRARALALGAPLLLSALARAQQADSSAAPTAFSCSDLYSSAALTWISDFDFQRLPARPAAADLPASVKPVVFGSFDVSRYGFERVEFYPHAVLPSADQYSNIETVTELRLYVRLLSPDSESWWQLVVKDEQRATLAADVTQFKTDDQDQHPEFSDDPAHLAAPDSALPLFRLAFSSRSTGASTVATEQTQLLMDLRAGTPRLTAQLSCSEVEGGGVCGAPDIANGPRVTAQCDWQPARQDYLCQSDSGSARHSYYLLSRRDAYVAPAGQPQSPGEFAEWIEKDRAWMERAPVLEGYGQVRALLRLPARDAVRYVMGAPGADHVARFLLVTLAPGAAPQVTQLPLRFLTEDPDAAPGAPQPDFPPDVLPTGPAVSFHLRRLDTARGLLLWQITATQGEQHAVYWVALEDGAVGAAQALEIATDLTPYYHCGAYKQPAAAYAVRLDPVPFRAALTVEPEVYTDEEDRYTDGGFANAQPRCPGHALVTWKAGQGFVIKDVSAECASPELPHRVVIGPDGRLTRLAPVVGQDQETKK